MAVSWVVGMAAAVASLFALVWWALWEGLRQGDRLGEARVQIELGARCIAVRLVNPSPSPVVASVAVGRALARFGSPGRATLRRRSIRGADVLYTVRGFATEVIRLPPAPTVDVVVWEAGGRIRRHRFQFRHPAAEQREESRIG